MKVDDVSRKAAGYSFKWGKETGTLDRGTSLGIRAMIKDDANE